jgi:hypothetical protein
MPSISNPRKSRGRPKVGATHIGVRLPPDQLARLDAWIASLPGPKRTRPEAIRQALEAVIRLGGLDPERED